ncbi:heterokaryon incompatibility protein-domain-containing protein [Hypoxylon argillaceum]|nr:heterokaryon incompatibility protein-domain-containing protein [Hypoxylon argillaceum]
MVALQYTRLDPSKKQIRLLKLMNGEWNDRIRCELYVVSLQDSPKYEALSYVWGPLTDLVDIDVNGVTFSATQNLHAALRRLRDHIWRGPDYEESRALWVDAICINQQDAEEKAHQVQLMGDIYSQTAKGLFWLGEQPDEPQPIVSREQDDEVTRLLKMSADVLGDISASFPHLDIAKDLIPLPEVKPRPGVHDFKIPRTEAGHYDSRFESDPLALEADSLYQVHCLLVVLDNGSHLRWPPYLEYNPDNAPAIFRTNTFQTLNWLGTRPWWSRIWTVQECIFPRDSELLYGPLRIPWRRFLRAISNFQKHKTSCCADFPGVHDMKLDDLVDTVLPCLTLHKYCHTKDFDRFEIAGHPDGASQISSVFRPESLLWTFRHRGATDPRDKIYGILSLLKGYSASTGQPAKALIIPDYSPEMSFEMVFTRTVISIMQFSASLDIICQPGHAFRDPDSRLPSWVPDFSQPIKHTGSLDRYWKQYPCYNACAGQSASPSVIEENILVLEGYIVDIIKSTSSSMAYVEEERQKSVMREWYSFVKDFYDARYDPDAAQDTDTTNDTDAASDTESNSDTDSNHAHDAAINYLMSWKDKFSRTLCGDTIMTKPNVEEDINALLRRIPPTSHTLADEEIAYNIWCRDQGLEDLMTGEVFPLGGISSDEVSAHGIGHAVKISTASRKMFVSASGHLGLGPFTCGLALPREDRLFVFPGGKTPFVLRYVGMRHVPGLGMQPCHELIGDCYLHGFMDGEGMEKFEAEKQTVYIV